jgi:hydrogenase maturation factor HypF (carbamoyltransferase family)
MQSVSDRLIEIALTTPEEDIAIKAATELRQMVAQDLAEESRGQPEQVEHHHTHDIGPVTESNIEAQRAKRLARLAGTV